MRTLSLTSLLMLTLCLQGCGGGREAAIRTQKKNVMKRIALAFHNYHDGNGHFPSVDSNGKEDEAWNLGKGLSWRVHLLPYLGEAALYEQFKFDEAWDSEHNIALVKEMPVIFRGNSEGKTSIHVFASEGLAFEEGKPGPRLRDYLDGTSDTILAVRAGDNTAEIWTKPGGLEFNVDNPIAALGNIGDMFMAMLCDGSVKYIPNSIDNSTLSNLIQHNDGNAVAKY